MSVKLRSRDVRINKIVKLVNMMEIILKIYLIIIGM